jgi:membrane protease YdiL (CAAX protease family)
MNFLENIIGKGNQFWKYLVTGLVAFVASGLIGMLPLMLVIIVQASKTGLGGNSISKILQNVNFSSIGISQNLFLLLLLLSFAVGLFAVILIIRVLHKRSFSETVNGTKKVRWNRVWTGFFVWLLLMALSLAIRYIMNPENFVLQFNIQAFIPLVFIALVFFPFQITFEELLFRGYLAQGIGSWTKSRWLVILIPSILFGLMHMANKEVAAFGFWAAMPHYILFGLIFGLASVLDDGIELAIGMHAANNIFNCVVVTFDASSLKTHAIFSQQIGNLQTRTIVLLVLGLIALFVFAKKYKWNFSVMNKKIMPNTVELNVHNNN